MSDRFQETYSNARALLNRAQNELTKLEELIAGETKADDDGLYSRSSSSLSSTSATHLHHDDAMPERRGLGGRGSVRSVAERDLLQRKFAVIGSYIKQLEYESTELTRMVQNVAVTSSAEHSSHNNEQSRRMWQMKVTSLCQSVEDLSRNHHSYQNFIMREHQEELRQRLLSGGDRKGDPNHKEQQDELVMALQQTQRLEEASSALDDILNTAGQSLDSLLRQRNVLQNIQRGVVNISNSLGLSTSLIRMIERKETFNMFIAYGCMVFTCVIVYMVWRWTRSGL